VSDGIRQTARILQAGGPWPPGGRFPHQRSGAADGDMARAGERLKHL